MNVEHDRGFAAERTTLAWRRSGISVIAAGIAVARGIPTVDSVPARPLLGLAIVALGLMSLVVSRLMTGRRRSRLRTAQPTAELRDLWPVTASTMLAALGAIVVVLLS